MANVLQLPAYQAGKRALSRLAIVLFVLALVARVSACPLQLSSIDLNIKGIQLNLEIAATPEARRCGLSGRNDLPPDAGMLFVLPEVMPFAVWMKDTRLPLDIAFIDDTGRILAIRQMVPSQKDLIYTSPQPVRYAIETRQNWFQDHHVQIDDILELTLPADLVVR